MGQRHFQGLNGLSNGENGNILESENVLKLFNYYLLVNTTFLMISALTKSMREEKALLTDLRNFLFQRLGQRPIDEGPLVFLIKSSFVYQKGNFKCSLEDLNENIMEDPTSLYNKIQNPLVAPDLPPLEEVMEGKSYWKQFDPILDEEFEFRAISLQEDLDLFYKWQHTPYVAEFWEMNKKKSELKEYLEGVLASGYQLPLMAFLGGKPIGYFEAYWAFSDRISPYCEADHFDRGFHLLIGEPEYLGTRVVREAINNCCLFLFSQNLKTKVIWGEPRIDNIKLQKMTQIMPGWKVVGDFHFPINIRPF